jgi:hypothetical protein
VFMKRRLSEEGSSGSNGPSRSLHNHIDRTNALLPSSAVHCSGLGASTAATRRCRGSLSLGVCTDLDGRSAAGEVLVVAHTLSCDLAAVFNAAGAALGNCRLASGNGTALGRLQHFWLFAVRGLLGFTFLSLHERFSPFIQHLLRLTHHHSSPLCSRPPVSPTPTMTSHGADHGPDSEPRIANLPLTSISKLAPFSALIISIIFVIYFFIKNYVLEGFLLRRMYGSMYTSLSDANRRGFLNHHIAGATKITILIMGAYPFIAVAMGIKSLYTPYSKGSAVKLGDMLIVASQMLIAMYVFELIYRPKVSPISMFHHVGTIMVGQSAIAISLNLVREKDADIEFILCCVWGKPLHNPSP